MLDSFPSEGALRIEWSATPVEDAESGGTFKLTMHSAISGRPLGAPVIDQKGRGKGIAFVSEEARVFFAVVESEGLDWTFTISERVQ